MRLELSLFPGYCFARLPLAGGHYSGAGQWKAARASEDDLCTGKAC